MLPPPRSCPKGLGRVCIVGVPWSVPALPIAFCFGSKLCSGQLLPRVGLSRMDFLLIKESDA